MQIEELIAREVAVAKELIAAKKRERALLALRKKRLREGQLEQIDAYLLNVEQVRVAYCCIFAQPHVAKLHLLTGLYLCRCWRTSRLRSGKTGYMTR